MSSDGVFGEDNIFLGSFRVATTVPRVHQKVGGLSWKLLQNQEDPPKTFDSEPAPQQRKALSFLTDFRLHTDTRAIESVS